MKIEFIIFLIKMRRLEIKNHLIFISPVPEMNHCKIRIYPNDRKFFYEANIDTSLVKIIFENEPNLVVRDDCVSLKKSDFVVASIPKILNDDIDVFKIVDHINHRIYALETKMEKNMAEYRNDCCIIFISVLIILIITIIMFAIILSR